MFNESKQKRLREKQSNYRKHTPETLKSEKNVREHITEKKLDKIVENSFPASDPASF